MIRTRVELAGVLLVDKTAGPTSHDVVSRARRALGIRGVGHAGTLDPFATGLLLICVGSATRLSEYFHLLSKSYVAELRLGTETDTHDATGEETAASEAWREVERHQLERTLEEHIGRLRQRPPAYSAKRVGGRRAYEAARRGVRLELDPVDVRIHALDLLSFRPPLATVSAVVSAGTYMRALARDVGRRLGCGAHLSALRRTAVGPFRVEEAIPEERLGTALPSLAALREETDRGPGGSGLEPTWWRRPAEAVAWLPGRELTPEEARRVGEGGRIPVGGIRGPELPGLPASVGAGTPVALLEGGRLLAVAEQTDGELQPRKVFSLG